MNANNIAPYEAAIHAKYNNLPAAEREEGNPYSISGPQDAADWCDGVDAEMIGITTGTTPEGLAAIAKDVAEDAWENEHAVLYGTEAALLAIQERDTR